VLVVHVRVARRGHVHVLRVVLPMHAHAPTISLLSSGALETTMSLLYSSALHVTLSLLCTSALRPTISLLCT
jgi:hypothetical protein